MDKLCEDCCSLLYIQINYTLCINKNNKKQRWFLFVKVTVFLFVSFFSGEAIMVHLDLSYLTDRYEIIYMKALI